MASRKCITDLPDELLLKIFSNLNIEDLAMSVQHVNPHWKAVSQDGSLWENQTFSPECKMSSKKIARHLRNMPALQAFCCPGQTNTIVIVDTLCKYCRDIRHIQFKGYYIMSNYRLHKILKKIPHLESLSIRIPEETDQLHFANLVGQFQKLRILNLFPHDYTIADGVLRAIADGCPSLQHLDIGFAVYQNEDIEYFLEKKGQQLLSFSVQEYISTVAHELLAECGNLEYLYYANRNDDLPSTYIHCLSKLSEMRNLTLRGQTQNVSTIFKNQSMSKLITLKIAHCGNFDGTSLTVILTNCPQLESLTVEVCVRLDCGFQYIGTCKNLKFLSIFGTLIRDKSMEYIGAGCPNLSHLNIQTCPQLTNKSIEYVCSGCQKLKYLGIQDCCKITDDMLENIFKIKTLEVLELSWNFNLLGINFLLIPSNLVHLTELRLHGWFSLDEIKCMDKLKEEMPHLLITGFWARAKKEETEVNLGDATFFISQLL